MGSVNGRRLSELIKQATVDADDESEQTTGFCTLTADERIVMVCSPGRDRQRIPILDLPLPDPAPQSAEWVGVYRAWSAGAWPTGAWS